MKPIDQLHIQFKEGVASRITVQRMLNQTLGRLRVDPKGFGGFFNFNRFLNTGGPSKVL